MNPRDPNHCPGCIFMDHYNRDGAFAAIMDYQYHFDGFLQRLKGISDLILTGTFKQSEGIRIPRAHTTAYVKTGLGILGFPDVAEVMEKNANEAKRLMQDRLRKLAEWDLENLTCEQSKDKKVTTALIQWKKFATQTSKPPEGQRTLVGAAK